MLCIHCVYFGGGVLGREISAPHSPGGEGIWGGTSWISLRSVHFLEVYLKLKRQKSTPSQNLQSLANTT